MSQHVPSIMKSIARDMVRSSQSQTPVSGLQWPSQSESEDQSIGQKKEIRIIQKIEEDNDQQLQKAFLQFVAQKKKQIQISFPSFTNREIQKASIQCWKEMDPRDKKMYADSLLKYLTHKGKQENEKEEYEDEDEKMETKEVRLEQKKEQKRLREDQNSQRSNQIPQNLIINFPLADNSDEVSNDNNSILTVSTQPNEETNRFALLISQRAPSNQVQVQIEIQQIQGSNGSSSASATSSSMTTSSLQQSSQNTESESQISIMPLQPIKLSVVQQQAEESSSSNSEGQKNKMTTNNKAGEFD